MEGLAPIPAELAPRVGHCDERLDPPRDRSATVWFEETFGAVLVLCRTPDAVLARWTRCSVLHDYSTERLFMRVVKWGAVTAARGKVILINSADGLEPDTDVVVLAGIMSIEDVAVREHSALTPTERMASASRTVNGEQCAPSNYDRNAWVAWVLQTQHNRENTPAEAKYVQLLTDIDNAWAVDTYGPDNTKLARWRAYRRELPRSDSTEDQRHELSAKYQARLKARQQAALKVLDEQKEPVDDDLRHAILADVASWGQRILDNQWHGARELWYNGIDSSPPDLNDFESICQYGAATIRNVCMMRAENAAPPPFDSQLCLEIVRTWPAVPAELRRDARFALPLMRNSKIEPGEWPVREVVLYGAQDKMFSIALRTVAQYEHAFLMDKMRWKDMRAEVGGFVFPLQGQRDAAVDRLRAFVGPMFDDLDLSECMLTGSAMAYAIGIARVTSSADLYSVCNAVPVDDDMWEVLLARDCKTCRVISPVKDGKAFVSAIDCAKREFVTFQAHIGAGADLDIAVPDETRLKTVAVAVLAATQKHFPDAHMVCVPVGGGSKYCIEPGAKSFLRMRRIELYHASPGHVWSHHVPPVRAMFTSIGSAGPRFLMTASAVECYLSGEISSFNYFASKKVFPQEVIAKYMRRGYWLEPRVGLGPIGRAVNKFLAAAPTWNKYDIKDSTAVGGFLNVVD